MDGSAAVEQPEKLKRWVRVRLATRKDAPWVHKLVGELAQHQRLTAAFVATSKELEDTLFNFPPYQGPTTFLLECSDAASEETLDNGARKEMMIHQNLRFDATSVEMPSGEVRGSDDEAGTSPIVHTQEIAFRHELDDTGAEAYECGPGRVVAGFVLFFPNYSTLVAKAGYYVEDLYIRAPFRGHGLGTLLLHTVALQALRRGAERLEWCVLDCDEEAIRFYKSLGATVLPDWRICRLSGGALARCRHSLQSLDLKPSKP